MKWITKKARIDTLKGWDKNPRKISRNDLEAIKRSLKEDGDWGVIVCDMDGTVISGNQRLKIMAQEGIEEADIKIAESPLSEKEKRRIALRANRTKGKDDLDLLADWDVEDLLAGWVDEDLGEINGHKREFNNPEIEFAEELLLEHNYVVLYFDNNFDWQVAVDKLGLKDVKTNVPEKSQKFGIGRVIKGKDVIDRL